MQLVDDKDQPDLLVKLLAVDIACRTNLGEEPTSDEYMKLFPAHSEKIAEVFLSALPTMTGAPRLKSLEIDQTLNTATEAVSPNAKNAQSADVGRRFGDCEIIEEIARGGMGVVYRAIAC